MDENPESPSVVTGFRVRLRCASAPRNDNARFGAHMIGFMESLDYQCMLTKVRSVNHDCADTKPCTFLLIARGLRSCTI